jgi:hypothetical protein
MADPQAEGGIAFSGDQPPTAPNVTASYPSDAGTTNRVKNIDINTVAPDMPGDKRLRRPVSGRADENARHPRRRLTSARTVPAGFDSRRGASLYRLSSSAISPSVGRGQHASSTSW